MKGPRELSANTGHEAEETPVAAHMLRPLGRTEGGRTALPQGCRPVPGPPWHRRQCKGAVPQEMLLNLLTSPRRDH